MSFKVIPTEIFKKEARRLIQKYPSLKQELEELNALLSTQPETGTRLGFNTYKIRLSVKSKGKGKRGGARVISYVVMKNQEVYILTIYDKSEFDSVDNKALRSIVASLNLHE